jgi:hypothetical protein
MNPAMISMALSLLQSGKLNGILGMIPGLDQLGGGVGVQKMLGDPAAQPALNVQGAIQILADHMPADPAAYIAAVTQAIQGIAALKKLAVA